MQVYTLVGKSGSGKSFHAMELCKKNHIEGIIDDGLFIYKNSIVAGVSAKRSQTKIGAVKVALFLDEEVCEQVKEAIAEKQPESILVPAPHPNRGNHDRGRTGNRAAAAG